MNGPEAGTGVRRALPSAEMDARWRTNSSGTPAVGMSASGRLLIASMDGVAEPMSIARKDPPSPAAGEEASADADEDVLDETLESQADPVEEDRDVLDDDGPEAPVEKSGLEASVEAPRPAPVQAAPAARTAAPQASVPSAPRRPVPPAPGRMPPPPRI